MARTAEQQEAGEHEGQQHEGEHQEKQEQKEKWPKHGFDGDPNAPGALCRECQQPKDAPNHFIQQDTPGGPGAEKKD